MMQKRGTPVDVRPIEISEVVQAHKAGKLLEAFGTGTAASISPIGVLGVGKEMLTINSERKGPLAADLYKSITDIQYGKAPDTMGWTSEVQLL
jgi:branched-chain amino acid aminotransferase